MEEETQDVLAEEQVATQDPSPEQQDPVQDQAESRPSEETDEKGVPLKNREAEAQRKAKAASRAQQALLSQETPSSSDDSDRRLQELADRAAARRLEPVLAKQFLMENPDAMELVDDINRIRQEYPEISGIDKLDVAYKVAKAERQEEILRKRLEQEELRKAETLEKAASASAQGTNKAKAPADSLDQRISQAASLKELQDLESMIAS